MGLGGTLTSGIQDIAAFLPIFGTDQCENHVGSALDNGYLYAAAAPLSLFGCLGIVKTAISVLFASVSAPFNGALKLSDAGFELVGSVAPMIGMSAERSFEFETTNRVAACLADKSAADDAMHNYYTAVEPEYTTWNLALTVWTLVLSAAGLTPYATIIHTEHGAVKAWIYPVLRVIGSALCAICVQFLLQRRIVAILLDDAGLRRNHQRQSYLLAALRLALVLGSGATAVGYVGCFNLLQDASTRQTLLWLVLEAILCVLRVFVWSLNPKFDEDIQLKLTLWAAIRQSSQATTSVPYESMLPRDNHAGQPFNCLPATQFMRITQTSRPFQLGRRRRASPFYHFTAALSTETKSLYFLCAFNKSESGSVQHPVHMAQLVALVNNTYAHDQTIVAVYKYRDLQPFAWYDANFTNNPENGKLGITLHHETSPPGNNLFPSTGTGGMWTVADMNYVVAQVMNPFNDPALQSKTLLISFGGRVKALGTMAPEEKDGGHQDTSLVLPV